MYEWFVVDARSDEIVNCVTTDSRLPPSLDGWIESEHLTVTRFPTQTQLDGYQYWNERP